jgi:oligopeptide/dipeptide ABC transporter ATP-binding protein
LDVSVQAQMLNLLVDLQEKTGVSSLFISHRVAVMYLGRIVEIALSDELWSQPAHRYTRALFDSVPRVDVEPRATQRTLLKGDLPSPYAPPPSGLPFSHPRCDRTAPKARHAVPLATAATRSHVIFRRDIK